MSKVRTALCIFRKWKPNERILREASHTGIHVSISRKSSTSSTESSAGLGFKFLSEKRVSGSEIFLFPVRIANHCRRVDVMGASQSRMASHLSQVYE